MIYLFDNGEAYSNHTLYFVEAPADFGTWFNTVYRPWVDGAEYRPLMIVGTTDALAWIPRLPYTARQPDALDLSIEDHPMKEFATMPVVKFMRCGALVHERNGLPRPRYHLEVA